MPEDSHPPVPDSSVRLVASNAINYTLIVSLVGSLLYGVWWSAHRDAAFDTLAAKVDAQYTATNKRIDDGDAAANLRISRIADDVMARLAVLEKRDEGRGVSQAQLDTRLTRIESKIDFLATNLTVAGPKK